MPDRPPTILAIASYDKGHDFLREAKRQGARVLLLTSLSLRETAAWPRESIDEIFFMPDQQKVWNRTHTLHAVCHLMRTEPVDRIVPLDDFDLEIAAFLREHTRTPGLGESQTRYFRDKLAMRMQARAAGLRVPDFTGVFLHQAVTEFAQRVPGPWVLKPRLMAGAIGIKKVENMDQLWALIHSLGDEQSYYVLERFVPGDVFHVDTVVADGEIRFAIASQYGRPPMEVSHGGGIFTTRIVERGSDLDDSLLRANAQVMKAMGLTNGVSHTEFIRGHADGEIYFLETSARVGGANIADLVEAASGVNPWREWAKLECRSGGEPYQPPPVRYDYAGLLVSLARQEWPDLSVFADPEVCWRMHRKHHVGLIVRSGRRERVDELLAQYTDRVQRDFYAALPPKERPTE
jgi:hypothetical protein